MTCSDLEIILCDYLDGTLPAAESASVRQHLAICPACAQFAADCGAVLPVLTEARAIDPPHELFTRLYQIPTQRRPFRGWTTGVRGFLAKLTEPLLQPRVVMGMAMTILSFSMLARCTGPVRQIRPADLSPVQVLASLEDRVHRGWERSVKFYDTLRFVYEIQQRVREFTEQRALEIEAETKSGAASDGRRLPGASQGKQLNGGNSK